MFYELTDDSNKASGLYGMRSEFVIDAAALLITPISNVFNKIFDTSFPSTHAIGRLCPIFKSGDEHDLDNYRGCEHYFVQVVCYSAGETHKWLG